MKAAYFLTQAQAEIQDRAKVYDHASRGQSMAATVGMFNALTGHSLTEQQGWKFMVCLKLVRSEQGEYRADNYVDGAAYMGLAGASADPHVRDPENLDPYGAQNHPLPPMNNKAEAGNGEEKKEETTQTRGPKIQRGSWHRHKGGSGGNGS